MYHRSPSSIMRTNQTYVPTRHEYRGKAGPANRGSLSKQRVHALGGRAAPKRIHQQTKTHNGLMRRARGLAGCDRYPGRAGRDNQKASALRWRAASGQGRLGRRTPQLRCRTKQDKIPGTFTLTCRSRANESGEQFATGVSLDLSLQVRLTNGTYVPNGSLTL